jgi:hypothetical protein
LLSQFPVIGAHTENGFLVFRLGVKHTDCLAKELCLPAANSDKEACCSAGGCC